MLTQKQQSNTIRRRIEVVVTGLTRNQLYRSRYRGFESHRLRHIKAVCLYTNKKTRENLSPFFVLLLGNCLASFTAGQSEIVTLAFSAPLARYSVASLLTNPTVSATSRQFAYIQTKRREKTSRLFLFYFLATALPASRLDSPK